MDAALQRGENAPRGLLVNYDLSHSGRRINNRIYPPNGQRDGACTVMSPYPKPILLHHNETGDVIGRFTKAEWEDTSAAALGFFRKIDDFMVLQKAFKDDSPKKIYDAMKRFGLLVDQDWPGVGRIKVQASIHDEIAIERFLDGRYLTFSAGSTTNRHVCSICDSDWSKGDFCEHRHGQVYGKDVCVFITGLFAVKEGSVAHMPADDYSQVSSMEFIADTDMPSNCAQYIDHCSVEPDLLYYTDSTCESLVLKDKNMLVKEQTVTTSILDADVRQLVRDLFAGKSTALIDALTADTHLEKTWLIRVHDALHSEYDWKLRYDDAAGQTPKDVYHLHGSLHDLAVAQGFRDSFLNGELDSRDSEGKESSVYQYPDSNDASETTTLIDTILQVLKEHGVLPVEKQVQDDSETAAIIEEEVVVKSEAQEDNTEDSEPVLVEDTTTTDAAIVVEAQEVKLDTSETSNDDDKYSELKNDYTQALLQVEQLTTKLATVFDMISSKLGKDFSDVSEEDKLTMLRDWSVTTDLNSDSESGVKINGVVENPSVGSTDTSNEKTETKQLGAFENRFINQYKDIATKNGETAANAFFRSQRRYLPNNFDPREFLGD